mgnify:CR=1 FL=1
MRFKELTLQEKQAVIAQNPAYGRVICRCETITEGEIVDALHAAEGRYDGVLLNAGGYTHTSVVIRDAIEAISTPVIEIHISNIAAREEFRHTSLIGAVAVGSIVGFGLDSYRLGVEALHLRK